MTEESDIKYDIKKYIQSRGGYITPVANGAFAKLGDADMVVCYKGLYVAIEGKTPTGSQEGWQITRMTQIRNAGGIYAIARTVDAVKQLLDEIDRRYPNGIELL